MRSDGTKMEGQTRRYDDQGGKTTVKVGWGKDLQKQLPNPLFQPSFHVNSYFIVMYTYTMKNLGLRGFRGTDCPCLEKGIYRFIEMEEGGGEGVLPCDSPKKHTQSSFIRFLSPLPNVIPSSSAINIQIRSRTSFSK